MSYGGRPDKFEFPGEYNIGSVSGNFAIDFHDGQSAIRTVTLSGNSTITALTNAGIGYYQLRVVNGGSFTLAWPGGAAVPQPVASGTTFYNLYWTGSAFAVQTSTTSVSV